MFTALHIFFVFTICFGTALTFNLCAQKVTGEDAMVCVCNATYCDDFPPLSQLKTDEVGVYVTSKSGKRFDFNTQPLSSDANNEQDAIKIIIDPSQRYQSIIGFGGYFTGSAGYNLYQLKERAAQDNMLKAYFGDGGIGYSASRVAIGATDFSLSLYSYDDSDSDDFNLTKFNITGGEKQEDLLYKIPALRRALGLNKNLKLFVSPFTAPAWMKDNGALINGGSIKGNFSINNDQYYRAFAKYFIKYFEVMHDHGIDFWGLTILNEPMLATIYPSMIMTAAEQRDFIKSIFGPAIRENNLTKDLKIMTFDFNRDIAVDYVNTVLADSNTSSYVDGISLHWYSDFGWWHWTDHSHYDSGVNDQIHKAHPNKWILNTEACTLFFKELGEANITNGLWAHADYFARDIIDNLNHWSTGFVDCDLYLNMSRGPYGGGFNSSLWSGSPVDAHIIVSDDGQEFYKQPSYYIMGHFSKLLVPNSIHIAMNLTQSINSSIQGVSFLTPSKSIVTILYNYNATNNITVSLQVVGSDKWLNIELESLSIATLVWNVNLDCPTGSTPSAIKNTTCYLVSTWAILLLLFIYA